jgi:pimeloyl-ACP methyl ester carboxylesterase
MLAILWTLVLAIAVHMGSGLHADAIRDVALDEADPWLITATAPLAQVSHLSGSDTFIQTVQGLKSRLYHTDLTVGTNKPPPPSTPPTRTQAVEQAEQTTQVVAVRLRPTRVLIIGASSIQFELGRALEARFQVIDGVEVMRFGRHSTGLSRPDYFDWPEKAVALKEQFQPDLIIGQFGGNDGQGMTNMGGQAVAKFFTQKWAKTYSERVHALAERLTADGTEFVMLGMPIMRARTYRRSIGRVNDATIAGLEGTDAHFINTYEMTVGDNNQFTRTHAVDGRQRITRATDGAHLTRHGAQRVSGLVMTGLEQWFNLGQIVPPATTRISSVEESAHHNTYTVLQTTDAVLDPPHRAGRAITTLVTVPKGEGPFSVSLFLHGFKGKPRAIKGENIIWVSPADPENGYWWGEQDGQGAVPDSTLKRANALLDWVLAEFPQADPHRVGVAGVSMGGAGALTLGLRYAERFAWINSLVGQTVPSNHRPRRQKQLAGLWEPIGERVREQPRNVWDEMDITRMLLDSPNAQNQFVTTRHSQADPIISFEAVTKPSPLTDTNFYTALQQAHIGHTVIWDQGGHMTPDPTLGDHWWDAGWNPLTDKTTYLRNNLAFPAFSNSSGDNDPFVGGDPVGGFNRHLRWNSNAIVDTADRFEIPLMADQTGKAITAKLPIRADVTPRRLQVFKTAPSATVHYKFGRQKGTVIADDSGVFTIPQLKIGKKWQTLIVVK